jgi:hypothetical protein
MVISNNPAVTTALEPVQRIPPGMTGAGVTAGGDRIVHFEHGDHDHDHAVSS